MTPAPEAVTSDEPESSSTPEPDVKTKPRPRVSTPVLRAGVTAAAAVVRSTAEFRAQAAKARRAAAARQEERAQPKERGDFLPPVSAGLPPASENEGQAPAAALVILLVGASLLLGMLVPDRAWARAHVGRPDRVRGGAMGLGLGILCLGLLVLVIAS